MHARKIFSVYIFFINTLFYIFVSCTFFKDHIVKSAAGHFALKRLINQDKERIQSASDTGKPQKLCRVWHLMAPRQAVNNVAIIPTEIFV